MSIIEKLIRKQEKLLNREEENYRLLKFEFQRCHDEKKNQEKRIADLQAASGGDSGPVPDGDELRAAQKELKEIKEEMAIIKPKLDGSETTIQEIKDALKKLLKDLRAVVKVQSKMKKLIEKGCDYDGNKEGKEDSGSGSDSDSDSG